MAPNVVSFATSIADLDLSLVDTTAKPLSELIREEDWSAVEARVDQCPAEVRMLSKVTIFGHKVQAYPLHYLMSKKDAPPKLTNLFLHLASTAASTPDSEFGSLPIHLACQHDASLTVIEALVNEFPEGLSTPDNNGNLPIHYACSLATPQVVGFLLERTDDEALARRNERKQNLLHLACSRYDVSGDMVTTLLDANEVFSHQRDWQGRFPVHNACMWHADTPVVKALLKAYPEAIHAADVHGLKPYGISRKCVALNTSHPTIQVLRHYRKQQHNLFVRGMDVAQFASENVSDRLHHHNKPVHAPRNLVD